MAVHFKNKYRTAAYITQYERTKILAVRAQQLSVGQPPLVDTEGEVDHLKIALKELEQRKTPNKIVRVLPDGTTETVAVKDLINLYDQVSWGA